MRWEKTDTSQPSSPPSWQRRAARPKSAMTLLMSAASMALGNARCALSRVCEGASGANQSPLVPHGAVTHMGDLTHQSGIVSVDPIGELLEMRNDRVGPHVQLTEQRR